MRLVGPGFKPFYGTHGMSPTGDSINCKESHELHFAFSSLSSMLASSHLFASIVFVVCLFVSVFGIHPHVCFPFFLLPGDQWSLVVLGKWTCLRLTQTSLALNQSSATYQFSDFGPIFSSLSFLICKMGMIKMPNFTGLLVRVTQLKNTINKCLLQLLAKPFLSSRAQT